MRNYRLLLILFFLFLENGYSQETDVLTKRQSDSIYIKAMKADGVKIISIRDKKYKVYNRENETYQIVKRNVSFF